MTMYISTTADNRRTDAIGRTDGPATGVLVESSAGELEVLLAGGEDAERLLGRRHVDLTQA